jgi:tetratricopeptide (TPR) repeat protein
VYTDAALRTLVWLDHADRALAYARLRNNLNDKVVGLLTVYNSSRERGQTNSSLLAEAHDLANSIGEELDRAKALEGVASALAHTGRYDEAYELAQSIEDDFERARALRELASALTHACRYDEAQDLAQHAYYYEDIYVYDERAKALGEVATALARAGYDDRASRLFSRIREVAQSIEVDFKQVEAFRQLASALAQAERYDEAYETALSIEAFGEQVRALGKLAGALVDAGRPDESEYLAQRIYHLSFDEGWEVLQKLADTLAQAGHADEADALLSAAYVLP